MPNLATHIIINAQKYNENDKHCVLISVTDNGIGIKTEIVDRLFKLDDSTTTLGTNNEKGSGLGLVLCKEFVEKQGGKIWVESNLEKGTRFSFTLPLIET